MGSVRGSGGCKRLLPRGMGALPELAEDAGPSAVCKEVLGLLCPPQHVSSFSFLTLSLPWHLRTAEF